MHSVVWSCQNVVVPSFVFFSLVQLSYVLFRYVLPSCAVPS
jgi:hypothetical protein